MTIESDLVLLLRADLLLKDSDPGLPPPPYRSVRLMVRKVRDIVILPV
jgi:hypothetical protein